MCQTPGAAEQAETSREQIWAAGPRVCHPTVSVSVVQGLLSPPAGPVPAPPLTDCAGFTFPLCAQTPRRLAAPLEALRKVSWTPALGAMGTRGGRKDGPSGGSLSRRPGGSWSLGLSFFSLLPPTILRPIGHSPRYCVPSISCDESILQSSQEGYRPLHTTPSRVNKYIKGLPALLRLDAKVEKQEGKAPVSAGSG